MIIKNLYFLCESYKLQLSIYCPDYFEHQFNFNSLKNCSVRPVKDKITLVTLLHNQFILDEYNGMIRTFFLYFYLSFEQNSMYSVRQRILFTLTNTITWATNLCLHTIIPPLSPFIDSSLKLNRG